MAVDGMAAANTLLSYDYVTPGYCLKYVWQAYQAHGAVSDGKYYPTAYSAWQQAAPSSRHEGDWNPPPGVPVYFGPKSSSSAGDVVISMGGGLCAATDWPSNGQTNQTTLVARQNQIQRPYLGWVDNILGYPVAISGPTPPPSTGRDNLVFIAIRKGSWFLIVPNGTGKNYAVVIGGQDKFSGFPQIEYIWDTSWNSFKATLQNPSGLPS